MKHLHHSHSSIGTGQDQGATPQDEADTCRSVFCLFRYYNNLINYYTQVSLFVRRRRDLPDLVVWSSWVILKEKEPQIITKQ